MSAASAMSALFCVETKTMTRSAASRRSAASQIFAPSRMKMMSASGTMAKKRTW